ncbi:MAG: nucleoid-associated protein, partial [Clostridiales bacterium]|nr:nucleoid-associated protein [Clostridiales bacterium]
MRYVKDILIEEVILDVLDTTLAKVKPLSINEVVETFIRKHIIKSLNSKDTYKAVFNNNSSLKVYIQELLQDQKKFKEISFDMARAYEEVSSNIEAADGDLLFVKFIADEQRCYGLMKLEYEPSYTHSFSEEEV